MALTSREKVIRAAIRVFSRKGFDGASMREIAEAARLTKPMIYYHFKNKKDLYLHILQAHLDQFYGRLDAIVHSPETHKTILGMVIDLYDETFRTSPDMFHLVLRETTGNGRFVDYLTKKYFSRIHALMTEFFKKGGLQGAFRPSLNYDLCSLTLIAILMFHFSQGRVIQQLSQSADADFSQREIIFSHIMSLFTL